MICGLLWQAQKCIIDIVVLSDKVLKFLFPGSAFVVPFQEINTSLEALGESRPKRWSNLIHWVFLLLTCVLPTVVLRCVCFSLWSLLYLCPSFCKSFHILLLAVFLAAWWLWECTSTYLGTRKQPLVLYLHVDSTPSKDTQSCGILQLQHCWRSLSQLLYSNSIYLSLWFA